PRDADNLSLRFENVCISRRGLLFYCTSFWNLQTEDLSKRVTNIVTTQKCVFTHFYAMAQKLLRKHYITI
ncbi:MAG: hypothetical protein E6507_08825, partial [Prevotella bivia]|nr:hypothetical protein [Prevotella bivia]